MAQHVAKQIAKFAVPKSIVIVPGLPKTRSGTKISNHRGLNIIQGKIMRRILRKIATGDFDELGDISTLSEPDVVQLIIDERNKVWQIRLKIMLQEPPNRTVLN